MKLIIARSIFGLYILGVVAGVIKATIQDPTQATIVLIMLSVVVPIIWAVHIILAEDV